MKSIRKSPVQVIVCLRKIQRSLSCNFSPRTPRKILSGKARSWELCQKLWTWKKTYISLVLALPKSISDKGAAKKQKSLTKIVFLDIRTTVHHTFPFSELQCLPHGDPRNLYVNTRIQLLATHSLLIYFCDNFGEYITEFKRVLSSSLWKCMAPSKMSISMSLFLMSRWTFLMFLEPLKLKRADCKSTNETWAVTQEMAVEYCSSFYEAMSSATSNLQWNLRHSFPISPIVIKTSGVNVPCSTSSTLPEY